MTATNLTETTVWYQTILKVAGEQSQLVVDGKFGPSTSQAGSASRNSGQQNWTLDFGLWTLVLGL